MEEKKIIKLKLHSIIIIAVAIVLVIGIVATVFLKLNNKDEEFKREPEAIVLNPDNVVSSEKKTNNENTVKIRYAYTYNVPTADDLNEMQNEEYGEDYIDILEIYLEGDKLTKINELIKNSSFEKADLSVYKDTNLAIGVGGTFEVTINNDIVLLMDQEWSMYTKDSDSYIIHTPEELFNEISTIVYEKAYGNSKSYDTSKITIISEKTDGEDVIIVDKKHIKSILDNLKYSKVNMNEVEMENEEIAYTVDLNNGIQVKVYFASSIGYIIDNSEKYYVAFLTDFEEIVSTLYENYLAGRNESIKANEIAVKYKGKEYKVTDKEKIENIIDQLIMKCQYNDYDFLKSHNESQFGDEDIIIQLEKCKIIIPGDISIGNRYYINDYGKIYMISGLSELETYFKDLVDYKSN